MFGACVRHGITFKPCHFRAGVIHRERAGSYPAPLRPGHLCGLGARPQLYCPNSAACLTRGSLLAETPGTRVAHCERVLVPAAYREDGWAYDLLEPENEEGGWSSPLLLYPAILDDAVSSDLRDVSSQATNSGALVLVPDALHLRTFLQVTRQQYSLIHLDVRSICLLAGPVSGVALRDSVYAPSQIQSIHGR
jgi:hypothetical protein